MLDETTNLKSILSRPDLVCERTLVAGEWIAADDGKTFAVTNPARGDVIAQVPDLGRTETARAIAAAQVAQKKWAALAAKERATVLRKWFDLMVAHTEDLALIMTAEQGKPLSEARCEIAYGGSFLEWFAEEAKRIYGETIPGHMADKRITVIKQPIGVATGITPWNFPNAMITRKVAPALAAGCAFVIKPSELTPLSALAMAKLAEEAGDLLPGELVVSVGVELVDHLVDGLTRAEHAQDEAEAVSRSPGGRERDHGERAGAKGCGDGRGGLGHVRDFRVEEE